MDEKLAKALVAEFIGTFALILIGIGAITHFGGVPGGLLGIALAHGLTIAVMVSATGAISGGHLNPAVTVGAYVGGQIDGRKTVAYIFAQLFGASVGAVFAAMCFGMTLSVVMAGTPDLGAGVGKYQGILVEAVLTFFLVLVVYGTAIDSRGPKMGGLFIGLTITLDILFGGPLTGAAMNPARAFGPALISAHWNTHLVYWIGPLLGGIFAGVIYGQFLLKKE